MLTHKINHHVPRPHVVLLLPADAGCFHLLTIVGTEALSPLRGPLVHSLL